MQIVKHKFNYYLISIIFVPLVLIFTLFILGEDESTPAISQNDFSMGVESMREEKYQEAVAYFTEYLNKNLVNANPSRDMGYLFRAQAHNAIGEYQLAVNDTNEGLKLNPRSRLLLIEKTKAYTGLKEYDNALSEINQIIEMLAKSDVKDPSLLLQKANIYSQMGDEEKELENYNLIIELDPKNIHYLQTRANLYKKSGDYKKAIVDYSKIIEIAPDFAASYNSRACLYDEIGQHELAENDTAKFNELTKQKENKLQLLANKVRSFFKRV